MNISTINEQLLELIKNNTETNDICQILNISKKQLKNRLVNLQNQGFNIKRKFFYNGHQRYVLSKELPKSAIEICDIDSSLFRAIAISDLHLGSKFDNLDYLKLAYEYCQTNDIHLIINGGDLIQGTLGPRKFTQAEDQIDYLLQNYPFDEHILNFIALGNHDADLIKTAGLDLYSILNDQRSDLIPLGYKVNELEIGEDKITLAHNSMELRNVPAKFKIAGHGHRFQFKVRNNEPTIFLPTLSDEIKDGFLPGMVEINLIMDALCFKKGIFRHFIIQNNRFLPVSNAVYMFEDYPKTLKK